MQCNIGARGRIYRLIMGLALLVVGVILLLVWARPTGQALAWVGTIACLAAGAFGVFEGWAGWCAVRAIGFRTKL